MIANQAIRELQAIRSARLGHITLRAGVQYRYPYCMVPSYSTIRRVSPAKFPQGFPRRGITSLYDLYEYWMPWIRFLCGRTCILLWILYGNMVDFSFIVSLYVSDLPNVTISTRTVIR